MSYCPICGTKIMVSRGKDQAAPSDGTPTLQARRIHHPLGQDLAARRTWSVWLALLLSLPTLSLPALLTELVDQASGGDDALTRWQLIQVTAPLTLAVVFFTIAGYRGWAKGHAVGTWVVLLGLLVLFGLSAWLALVVGPCGEAVGQTSRGGLPGRMLGMVLCSLRSYGLLPFLSSLLIGFGVGWAWEKKILPHRSH